jgi:hypothetical protein
MRAGLFVAKIELPLYFGLLLASESSLRRGMSEKIFLTYTNATAMPYTGWPIARHVVVNYVDTNGVHHRLQGVPARSFAHNLEKGRAFLQEQAFSNGLKNTDSSFGRLKAHQSSAESAQSGLGAPQTIIAAGDNHRTQWNRMLDFAHEADSIGYEYRPYSQNSNSFAASALKHAGLLGPGTATPEIFDRLIVGDPSSGETSSVWVPGFDERLENPINAFNNRFGSWTSMRAGIAPRDPRRPSVFDTSAPAVPFAPRNDLPSPDNPASFDDRFGTWQSSPPIAPEPQPDNTIDPRNIRVLRRVAP